MTNKLILADGLDVLSYVLLQNISMSEVVSIVYTVVLIASVILGIVLKIVSAVKDGKITKEEASEIKKALDDAKTELEELKNNDKEDK